MKLPKITCIIPCYNAEKWIEKSIKSVISQSYEDLEVIVIDNQSSDKSLFEINRIKEEIYPNLIVGTAPNIYPFAWDECVEVALPKMTGEYFFIMGADDVLDPNYVRNNILFILNKQNQTNEEILIWQSPLTSINERGEMTGSLIKHNYDNLEELKSKCLSHCPITTPSVFYSKKLIELGLYKPNPKEYSGATDYDLYCQLVDAGVFIHIIPCFTGYYYRWHAEQCTWGMHKQPENYDLKIQNKWKAKWQRK